MQPIRVKNLRRTCGGCPTIFEWENEDGVACYFRFRFGHARIHVGDECILEDKMGESDLDGSCSFEEARSWAYERGVPLV